MAGVRWRKVKRDLIHTPTRTLLVVLSITVGVFVFGTIMATQITLQRELRASFLATNPPSAIITTVPFDDELVEAARDVRGVAQAQGRRAVPARIQVGPNAWQEAVLYVLPDDGAMEVSIVRPYAGAWPPPDHAVLIERTSTARARATPGDTLHIALPGQHARELPVAGLTHDLSLPPAVISGQVFGYITFDTLEWLGGTRGYQQLAIVVEGDRTDPEHIRHVAAAVERLLKRSGREVHTVEIPPPLQHPVEILLPTMMAIMTTIGSLALVISTFLIINTINAILTQQTRQIGVMKAIGAGAGQIARLYLGLAAAFGALALLLAAPLSALGARALSRFLAGQLNVDLHATRLPPEVLVIELIAALLVPLVVAGLPIRAVVRQPAHAALAGATTAPVTSTPLDGLIGRLTFLGRPTRLALRNTFRRRARLARTVFALALGGAVFVAAMTLRLSLFATLDASIASQRYDIEIQFSRPYRAERIASVVASAPGVTEVESLLRTTAFPMRADGSTGEAMAVRAMPADTTMYAPRMAEGRWLRPGDTQAVVLSTNITYKERGIGVGDPIHLEINGKTSTFQVVGLIEEIMPPVNPVWVYMTLDGYTTTQGGAGRSDTLRVATTIHDAAGHGAMVAALERRLADAGFDVRVIHSRSEDRAILAERFNLISVVLSILALLIGLVGGLGLAGTMSINVLERTREIGIMRAIGASDGAIQRIIASESVAIALLAWLVGTLLSMPLSYAMCYGFGKSLLNIPLRWVYALPAVGAWLVAALLIAVAASLLPARTATRLTVREVLAYE